MLRGLASILSVFVVLLVSCGPDAPPRQSPVQAPASGPDLQAAYDLKLVEIQRLNKEMSAANERLEFGTVNAKAKEALVRTGEARGLAEQFDDPTRKAQALAAVGKLQGDFEYLVKVTGG